MVMKCNFYPSAYLWKLGFISFLNFLMKCSYQGSIEFNYYLIAFSIFFFVNAFIFKTYCCVVDKKHYLLCGYELEKEKTRKSELILMFLNSVSFDLYSAISHDLYQHPFTGFVICEWTRFNVASFYITIAKAKSEWAWIDRGFGFDKFLNLIHFKFY